MIRQHSLPLSSRAWLHVGCGLGVALAALGVGLLFSPLRSYTYDASIMAEVTRSMLTDGTFRVTGDSWGVNTPYASYGLGMSLIFVPPYWLARHLGRDPNTWVTMANAFIFALTVLAIFWLSVACGATRRQGVITSLLVGFGTLLFPYAVTGLSEPAVGLGIAIGLASLAMATRRPVIAGAVAGAAAGFTVIMRTDSLLLVAPILAVGVWLLGGRRWSVLLAYAAAAAPWVVVVAAYNALRFGAPWRLGYSIPGVDIFNHPIPQGLYGLTLSPAAGLLCYVPLVLVALIGLPRAARRLPTLTAVAVALLLIRLPVYAHFFSWNGGGSWGPRYLTPAMPALTLGILEVVRAFATLRIPARVAVAAVATLSILVQLPGLTVDPGSTRLAAATSQLIPPPSQAAWIAMARPQVEAQFDHYFFDWRYSPIQDQADKLLHGSQLMSRYLPHQRPGEVVPAPRKRALLLLGGVFAVGMALAWFASSVGPERVEGIADDVVAEEGQPIR